MSLDAMKKRAQKPNHEQIIEEGIKLLDHPDLDPKVRAVAAAYLIGAKHFKGPHPAIEKWIKQFGGSDADNQ